MILSTYSRFRKCMWLSLQIGLFFIKITYFHTKKCIYLLFWRPSWAILACHLVVVTKTYTKLLQIRVIGINYITQHKIFPNPMPLLSTAVVCGVGLTGGIASLCWQWRLHIQQHTKESLGLMVNTDIQATRRKYYMESCVRMLKYYYHYIGSSGG